jgi:hypothetical protein
MPGLALLYGHSTSPPLFAVSFILFGLVMTILRARARGRGGGPFGGPGGGRGPGPWGGGGGPWGGGPPSGGGSSNEPPIQWDIRKPVADDGGGDTGADGGGTAGEEHNPLSDL